MLLGLALLLSSEAASPDAVTAWVNGVRLEQRIGPLKRNVLLDLAAQRYAAEMARSGTFSHTDREGRGPGQRVESAGYRGYERVAENLALGSVTAEETVALWMESPGHRRALLDGSLREMGVGIAQGPDGPLWVWIGGARWDDYPIMVELDMPRTNRASVAVWASGGGQARQMRWRWDGDTWTDWSAGRTSFEVPFARATGRHRFEVEYRWSNGRVMAAADEIDRVE
jgi:hypothetical protein